MTMERGTRVDLLRVNYECRARWRSAPTGTYREKHIRVGLVEDGRWFVELTGYPYGCRAYATKAEAWMVVQNLMRTYADAPWEQVPCYPTPPGARHP